MSEASLFLLHTRPDPRLLAAWAARHGLLQARNDLGYGLHALMRAAFGDDAPQPYRHLDGQQGLLAYTRLGPDEMRQRVSLIEPDVAEALGLAPTAHHGGYSLRPFPTHWPAGKMLRYEVRVRPVIREGKTGKERDAFLVAAERGDGGALDRAAVYAQWLADQLKTRKSGVPEPWHGAVELLDVRLEKFRLLDVLRQTQRSAPTEARQRRAVGGPDAVLSGVLSVVQPQAFAHLLSRGIGRHRAFGFGMLLLKPVD